ncbi:MAG: rod shape-determining protein [Clostridiales bacterium]|nr:rod shape-determining protein [Clostridiales bacterium]
MLTRDLGIDLGTANTQMCSKKGGIVIDEPSVVAVDVKTKRVLAVGNVAKSMIGRTPGSIVAVHPLKNGVIADFDMTTDMLRDFMGRSARHLLFTKTRIVISVPSGVTEVERKAVEDAARNAGAQEVELIEKAMAAAIGAGLPTNEPTGTMVADIGAGTTDIAVISLGGIAASRCVKTAGDAFDEAIVNYMKKNYDILIGDRTAEDVKLKIGSVYEYGGEGAMEVRGRSLNDGLPTSVEITSEEIRDVLLEPATIITDAIRETLEVTLPELAADIIDRGIYLTGGSSQLRGIDQLIAERAHIAVHIAENPTKCVALGTSIKLRKIR